MGVIFIAILAYFAYKRGHNGVLIVSIVLLLYAFGFGVGLLIDNSWVVILFWAVPWVFAMIYVFAHKGERGDVFDKINNEVMNKIGDEDSEEEIEVSDTDYVTLATFTQSWEQQTLNDYVEVLRDASIPIRTTSGAMATILVQAKDFDKASELIDGIGS